jgi:acyl-[acyl-carrier-protein]-phospholipid O-acyltransferase/long-chain-fatty-acid--[acyl-carrier-protein] ligase
VLLMGADGGEPERVVVLSSANLAASAAQTAARLALSPADRLCSTLPPSQAMGLTAGLVLPLVTGVRTLLPPPEPDPARAMQPTILIGDDASLAAYAKEETDFAVEGLRLVLAAEPVRRATRQAWRERAGLEIVEGYALPEAAGLLAVNTATHGREGSSGRLMPAMEVRIEPSGTHEPEGRLWIRGPNVLLGSMSEEAPGVLQPPLGGWHDTGRRVAIDREGYLRLAAAAEPMAKSA